MRQLVHHIADSHMNVVPGFSVTGSLHLLKWQALTAAWVIVFSAIGTFLLLKLVGVFVPLRMSEEDMEMGDLAVHGHEVYPSDIPSLAFPSGLPAHVVAATQSPPLDTGSVAPSH